MEPYSRQAVGEIVRSEKSAPAGIEPRRLMWAVAEVSWADAAGRPIRSRATIVDISTSGACIRLRHQIGVGSYLTVKWHREQFSAIARNCRADGPDYLLGVRRDNGSAPATAAKPAGQAIAEKVTSSAPTASATSTIVPAVRSAAVREVSNPAIRSQIPEQRAGDLMKKSPRLADSESRGATVRTEAGREERKAMQPKRLFPHFWRRQHAAEAPTQLAPKEASVNKPVHSAEHVSDPPARLLSYEDIYHAAGIISPRSGYDIRKVVEMLNSERIRDLSKDIQRASVLMALDAAGASVGELLQDATRRQQALNAYEDAQRKQLQEFEARKAQEDTRVEAEMQRILAHYTERLQQNRDEVARHKEALHNWQMAKQHESQRITEVMELCGKQAAPASDSSLAAAAGASGLGTGGGPTSRPATPGDSSK
jgi:hypothetical protein